MAKSAGWEGGDNYVMSPQWGSGPSNSGIGNKQFGLARRKKRGRWVFNSQMTPCSHVSCIISARAKIQKELDKNKPRPVKIFTSKAKGIFS